MIQPEDLHSYALQPIYGGNKVGEEDNQLKAQSSAGLDALAASSAQVASFWVDNNKKPSMKPMEARSPILWWSLKWWRDAIDTWKRAESYRVASEANKESVRLLKIDLEKEAEIRVSLVHDIGRLRNEKDELSNELDTAIVRGDIAEASLVVMEGGLLTLQRSNAALRGVITRMRKAAKNGK